ncbi:MAG: hypothetical protein ACC655_05575 [Rhodothermia bacterium]
MEPERTTRNEQESLSALRDHVSRAVDEIVRLRAQNNALARRLSKLESDSGGVAINLAGATDPEELRSTITGFIDAIDRYLASDDDGDDRDGGDGDGDHKV